MTSSPVVPQPQPADSHPRPGPHPSQLCFTSLARLVCLAQPCPAHTPYPSCPCPGTSDRIRRKESACLEQSWTEALLKGVENGRGLVWVGDSSQDNEGHTFLGASHAQAWGLQFQVQG